ncbi:MAG: NAD(P)H-dependent glycerol-3-phosphate dehydrogenase [Ilumatobacteraceae bacterium]
MGTRLCVVGGGSWGTTIAALATENADTVLWVRREELAREVNDDHLNSTYLADHRLPQSLRATADLDSAVSGADVIAMAVPSRGMREVASQVARHARPGTPMMSLAKGLERGTLLRMSEVITQVAPGHEVAVLSGPNLAREILVGQPTASVVACQDPEIARMLQELFSRPTFRLYTNSDVIGCEIGGVVKNVVAIAAGIVQGFGFGDNTRATLVTRGLAEMSRLGVALGANALTFAGLAGMGDVMATCSSSQSRNTNVGIRLGHGESIAEIMSSMTMVAEGVSSASSVLELARRHNVEMPITQQVSAICEAEVSAADALLALMGRTNKPE